MRSIKFESQQFSDLSIDLPLSKSISNRLQLLQALWPAQLSIEAKSTAEDSLILDQNLKACSELVDCGMAGTAYRFLTAYFAIQEGSEIRLDGDKRMRERPIGVLVDALRLIGADISYLAQEGYPPLLIRGKRLNGGAISIDSTVSSQFISALLLVAGTFKNGLRLQLEGEESSAAYTDMTIALLKEIGFSVARKDKEIEFRPFTEETIKPKHFVVEADWSSAAFFYQLLLFHPNLTKLQLNGLQLNSIQGDAKVAHYFSQFGILTEENEAGLCIKCHARPKLQELSFDLKREPDLAPALMLSAAFFAKKSTFGGIKSLRIKESDRITALKTELARLGVKLSDVSDHEVKIERTAKVNLKPQSIFKTYQDHRIAMALAPLACMFDEIQLDEPAVVSKSFPDYWAQASKCGLKLF
jgi:3-phosphoshikimate 1-carboxyvinyltransferase